MNEKVKEYLQKAKEAEIKNKNAELIKRGLYDKKYYEIVPDEKLNVVKYCDEKNKYYEIIPIELTDEEYNEVLKVPIEPDKNIIVNNANEESLLPTAFHAIGILIIIIGAIGGYKIAEPKSFLGSFNFQVAFILWISALISGMSFVGFGKIIQLLENIKNKSVL